jgi:hypothetical protein
MPIDPNAFSSQLQPQANPLQQLGQVLALKNAVQQQKAGNIELQQHQQALKDQQAMTAAMQEWDGKDFNALPGLMLKKGASAQAVMSTKSGILEQQQKLATLGKDQLANEAIKNDRFAQSVANVRTLPPDQQPQAFEAAKADAVKSGYMDPAHAQQLVYQGPKQLDLLEKSLIGHKASLEAADKLASTANTQAELPGKQADSAQKQRMAAANKLAMAQTPQAYQSLWGQLPANVAQSFPTPDQWTPKSRAQILQAGMTPEQVVTTQQGAQRIAGEAAGRAETHRHNIASEGSLTPEALTMAANQFATTGQMPQMGRDSATRKLIMNEAARLYPTLDAAGNAAAYKANSESLKALQKNFDQVTAFENTAGKNLDVFLNTAKKVVDFNSPLVNQPLRAIEGKLAGNPDQAAFSAARTTALTEIAKVLNSSNASGVLSDSARHEVEGLIGPDATLKQIYSAANILKQDMANRHEAYQDQINAIAKRTSLKAPTSSGSKPPLSSFEK